MSTIVPYKNRSRIPRVSRAFRTKPNGILFRPKKNPRLEFGNDVIQKTTCLGCHDAPCMQFDKSEIAPWKPIDDFPMDPSREVCPVGAIEISPRSTVPAINNEKCIGCGICAIRCPYGAISLANEVGTANVQSNDPDNVTVKSNEKRTSHQFIPKRGKLGTSNASFLVNLSSILDQLGDTERSRLVRNTFLTNGIRIVMRRRGDTNLRMDGILHMPKQKLGVLELETNATVLESPRALLDDVAVLHSRFDIALDEIVPISILGALPNTRTEYYQVIEDISKVLKLQCRTLTIGALFHLVWRFRSSKDVLKAFHSTAKHGKDIYRTLKKLDPKLPKSEPYPGAYRPPK